MFNARNFKATANKSKMSVKRSYAKESLIFMGQN